MRDYLSRSRAKEEGITMVAVLAAFTILIVVVLGSLAYLTASTKYSRYEQDNDLALAAAKSGLNDLLSILRAEPKYLNPADVAATKGEATGYCQNEATGGPPSEGDIYAAAEYCGWTEATKIETKEFGPANGGHFQAFHYAVTNYEPISMTSWVVSTGYSNSVVRSIRARISQDSTPMYLYMSNWEVVDPTDFTVYTDGKSGLACGQGYPGLETIKQLGYSWEIDDPDSDKPERAYVDSAGFKQTCAEPSFEVWDTLDGPVHSNDTIKSRGAKFFGGFTTADPACQAALPEDDGTWRNCVEGSADFGDTPPAYHGYQEIPQVPGKENLNVKNELESSGCEYFGATRIVFEGDNMRVWSKDTVNPAKPDRCGTAARLGSVDGALVKIPPGSLIYVRDLDPSSPGYADRAKPVPSGYAGGLPLGTYNDAYASAPTGLGDRYEIEVAMDRDRPLKFAQKGNLWLEGETDQSVTVYSDSSIIVTGDLLTAEDTEDLLGLMAGDSVEIYNPILRTYEAYAYPGGGFGWTVPQSTRRESGWPHEYQEPADTGVLRIEAAMIAGKGSFLLQNWKSGGPLGDLQVFGSIAQNFRGVVAQETDATAPALVNGYRKYYQYNTALIEEQPLLFSPIGNGDWHILWQEKVNPSDAVKRAAP